jgi:C1A family cysteine protease
MCLHNTGRRGPLRWITLAVILGPILLTALPSYAQLTADSIAALRERGKQEGWTFTVGENDATKYSLSQLCGTKVPDNFQTANRRMDAMEPAVTLPAKFDWRTVTGLPPIRNQGGCGSCWAFSTVGGLECAIKIYDDQVVNLSEQWLVSCNRQGWGCNGGWLAYDYYLAATDACNGTGAVMETDFPYLASDLPCRCPYPHSYKIESWAYIGSSGGIPSVASMKQAIMEYGPISVCVSANSAMQGYMGGIFNSCASSEINHAVVLVGWDDTQGNGGVWIMRNSWGTNWGEAGYMRMPYNCSMIGYGAVYINYVGVRFAADTTLGAGPRTVSFTGLSAKAVSSWLWDFGDGGSSPEQNPTHTYQPGCYDVKLTIQAGTRAYQALKMGYVSVYADTMATECVPAAPGQKVKVNITAKNFLPLREVRIPFCWSGPYNLKFDSASTVGLRTDYMGTKQLISYDISNKRATFYLNSSMDGTIPDLAAGYGAIVSLYFTVPKTVGPGPQYITMPSYNQYAPTFTAVAGNYNPVVMTGVLSSCSPGDVDDNGAGPDISDMSYLVDYLFSGGAVPPVYSQANIDAIGGVDIGDLTFLVSYLFEGTGTLPSCQ